MSSKRSPAAAELPDQNVQAVSGPGCVRRKLFLHSKHILAYSADGANPVLREILKRCARCDAVVWIADLRVIHIATGLTYIFLHIFFPPDIVVVMSVAITRLL